jgi:hypothetical protein
MDGRVRSRSGGDPFPCGQVNIGDNVYYDGRLYVLRGVDPMSVLDREALLEDPASGDLVRVPLDEVQPAPAGPGFESEGLG